MLDAHGDSLGHGRIDYAHPEDFLVLVRRWPGCCVVFEVGMNWHWLFEILERELSPERIVLANPFKTRIIAEAQIKTDKIDARILADLLRGRRMPFCRALKSPKCCSKWTTEPGLGGTLRISRTRKFQKIAFSC